MLAQKINPAGVILQFPSGPIAVDKPVKHSRTNSPLKSNGQPKATAAEPFRNMDDVHKMQKYFLDRKEYRNYLLVTLGISFALRAGDLLSLTWGDLFDENGDVKNVFYLYEDKTNKRNRITINERCREALITYKNQLVDDVYTDDPIFPSKKRDKNGFPKPLSIQQVNNILRDAAKICGIKEHISSHSLRKTYANYLIKASNGSNDVLYALQYGFNHSDIRVTLRYSGIQEEEVAALREQVGSQLI